ncbi:MAG: DUF1284 domain-containing protein [Pseudomonadota bacterium]
MTVRLRPHHLLCTLTYSGEGYSEPFIENFNNIIDRLAAGETVQIVNGPDDICAPLVRDQHTHCNRASVRARDRQAADDIAALLGQAVGPGDAVVLDQGTIGHLRHRFATHQIRSACKGCEWYRLCSSIADQQFQPGLLQAKPQTKQNPKRDSSHAQLSS